MLYHCSFKVPLSIKGCRDGMVSFCHLVHIGQLKSSSTVRVTGASARPRVRVGVLARSRIEASDLFASGWSVLGAKSCPGISPVFATNPARAVFAESVEPAWVSVVEVALAVLVGLLAVARPSMKDMTSSTIMISASTRRNAVGFGVAVTVAAVAPLPSCIAWYCTPESVGFSLFSSFVLILRLKHKARMFAFQRKSPGRC